MIDLSQELESARTPSPQPFDLYSIDDTSDAELDSLTFGVIALDAEGFVLRYNLYESRFARLDRNNVVGRNFFEEVAPCTRVESFEGRFRTFVTGGSPRDIERFDFTFDFKFGAQHVMIELVRASRGPRWYLLVNRTRVTAARPEFPAELLAAEQRALAPEEMRQGVLRDDLERRVVDAPVPFFAALRATCDRLAPESWQVFATEWGVQWGRRTVVDLEASSLESNNQSLRDLPMRQLTQVVGNYLSQRGWGGLMFDFGCTSEGILLVDIHRSVLAEAAPRAHAETKSQRSDDLSCHIVAGCLGGILSAVADRRLAAREVACIAGGAPRCSIVIVGHDRRAIVDEALKEGRRGVESIRASLRRAPRTPQSGTTR